MALQSQSSLDLEEEESVFSGHGHGHGYGEGQGGARTHGTASNGRINSYCACIRRSLSCLCR